MTAVVRVSILVALLAVCAGCSSLGGGSSEITPISSSRKQAEFTRKNLVVETLNLAPAEAKEFWPVYEQYRGEMSKNTEELGELLVEFGTNFQGMSDAKAKSILNGYLANRKKQLEIRQRYVPRFEKVLPGVKVMRFYQIENKLDATENYQGAQQVPLAG